MKPCDLINGYNVLAKLGFVQNYFSTVVNFF